MSDTSLTGDDVPVPPVIHDTEPVPATGPSTDAAAHPATDPSTGPSTNTVVPDPVARVRRLLGSSPEVGDRRDRVAASPALTGALARFDAPVEIRVRGGLGSGRRTLATALRTRRGWRVTVDDVDEIAAPGATPRPVPDVEILCLRTAPCRHEESWIRRARRHPLMVVAVGVGDDDDTVARPAWARDLAAVDPRDPKHRSVDQVISFVERALDALPSLRVARLETELERLAVDAEVGDLAEAALCALHHERHPAPHRDPSPHSGARTGMRR